MSKTNYQDVYIDTKGQFYYDVSLGTDKITGKRIKKKSRKNLKGKKFLTAKEAYAEAVRVKNDYLQSNGYSNYDMTYEQFMNTTYLPYYKSEVKEQTYLSRIPVLTIVKRRFGNKKLKDITVRDVQSFRTWLLTNDETGFSASYAALIFGVFRKSLDFAVSMQYLDVNISKKVKAIPKAKTISNFWTKNDFETVINQICIDDYYEHLCFVIMWLYFCTGVRLNEGTALWWNNLDIEKKELRVSHMLISKNKNEWHRQNHTKTDAGLRKISLDDDTVQILSEWKLRQATMCNSKFILSYDGMPMIKSTISRIIKRYAKLANVPEIQAKELRHSHASYLINELNASVLIVSKRLGHSSPEITLKHYAHMWNGVDKELASQMTGLIKVNYAEKTKLNFVGNQSVKR